MKKLLSIAAVVFLTACSSGGNMTANHESVLIYLKSGNEPSVKDAVWADSEILKVGMYNNNTSRNGFAEYLCNIIYDKGLKNKGISIKIIDYAKLIQANQWVNIGSANCI